MGYCSVLRILNGMYFYLLLQRAAPFVIIFCSQHSAFIQAVKWRLHRQLHELIGGTELTLNYIYIYSLLNLDLQK